MADTYYARFFDSSGAAITGSNGQTWLAIPNPNIDVSSVVSPSYSGSFASQAITLGSDPITSKLFDAVTSEAHYREIEIAHYNNGHLVDAYQFTVVAPGALSIDFDSGAQQLSFDYGGVRASHYNANGTTSSIQTHDLVGHSAVLKASDGTVPVATVTPAQAEPVASNSPVAAQDTYVRFLNPSTGDYLIAADGTTYFHVISTDPVSYRNSSDTGSSGLKISELSFTIDPASITSAQQGSFIPASYSTVIVAAYNIPSDGSAGHFVEGGKFGRAAIDNAGSDPSTGEYTFSFSTVALSFAGSSSSAASDGSVSGFPSASWTNQHNISSNPCFATGTLISTSRGEVPVEALAVGDYAVTASGQQTPIKWIGRRHTNCARHPDPIRIMPVRIRAGAVAPGMPARDLRVSPDHAIAIDGVLVKATCLVNGVSIVRESVPSVTYWHVELDGHDLLVADGLPAESYIESDNRHAFGNAGTASQLHPDFEAAGDYASRTCLPLVEGGKQLKAIRAGLFARVAERFTADPDVRLLADGVALAPVSTDGRHFRFDVAEGTTSLRLVSHSAIASEVQADVRDHRRFGIMVGNLYADGVRLCFDALGEGWLAQAPGRDHRWTDGNAALPLARAIAFTTASLERYPLTSEMEASRAA